MGHTNKIYHTLSPEQLDKVGNAMIYLSREIPNISKTKLLKLLYILDEQSVQQTGIPFFNLQYKVWKLGPVAQEVFIDLSDRLFLFGKYVNSEPMGNNIYITPNISFCDDEFSDNDIRLLSFVANKFKNIPGKDIVEYTHRPNSLWRNAAEKYNVLHAFESGEANSTDIIINLGDLVKDDKRKKSIYQHYIEEN